MVSFNTYPKLEGLHAPLSPSKYHWMFYDDDKFDRVFMAQMEAARGTKLHAIAADLIRMRIKLPDEPLTMNMYVNDAIGFHMTPEQPLYYSKNCFGTADAISFRRNKLLISDLKNGTTASSIHQLEGYAALFCLEYRYSPFEVEIELRIYQNNECQIFIPAPGDIMHIMEQIKRLDSRAEMIREELDF